MLPLWFDPGPYLEGQGARPPWALILLLYYGPDSEKFGAFIPLPPGTSLLGLLSPPS
jgi:hypothetical protein